MIQVLIFLLTSLAITFVNIKSVACFAPVFGVMVQPLWFYETFTKKQWGMFILSIYFTCMWIYGLVNEFPNIINYLNS